MSLHPGRILFEDEHFLAVHKLSRELVVKGSGKVERLPLLDFLKKDYPGLRPAQRLDFETSGVVLFAKSKAALEATIAQQKAREWMKTYRTIVAGRMKADHGEITKPLPARMGRESTSALTRYRVLERLGDVTYLETDILTGRHHQIRRHLAEIRHPLVLDHVYGDVKLNRAFAHAFHYHYFFLHAYRLAFSHPFTGKAMMIEAPMPEAFVKVLERLRKT